MKRAAPPSSAPEGKSSEDAPASSSPSSSSSSSTAAAPQRDVVDDDSSSSSSEDELAIPMGPDREAVRAANKEDGAEDKDFVDVEFEFFDPCAIDFHGVRNLLLRSLWQNVAVSPVTDSVIGQVEVGTMVKTAGNDPRDNDPYGFVTLLSLSQYRATAWFAETRALLLDNVVGDGGTAGGGATARDEAVRLLSGIFEGGEGGRAGRAGARVGRRRPGRPAAAMAGRGLRGLALW